MKFTRIFLIATILSIGIQNIALGHTRITTDLNWTNEIRGILEDKCMTCHHPGGLAPDYINLTIYGSDTDPGARAWAVAIEEEILTGRMPPWKPDDRFSAFSNSKQLTVEETDKIIAWVRGGAPQGPNRKLAMPEQFEKPNWSFGNPDIVFGLPEPFVLAPDEMTGEVSHTFDVVIEEDTFITGYEFLIENPQNIYSMDAWLLEPEGADATRTIEVEIQKEYDPLADEDDLEVVEDRTLPTGPQFLGQWVRGDHPVLFPDEAGRLLRKGSKIRVSIQYARPDFSDTSIEVKDQSKLGLFLAGVDEEIDLLVESFELAKEDFSVKADKRDQKIETTLTLEEDVHLVSLAPRLGPVAQDLEVSLTYPDGRSKTVLWIPEFKQKWTSSYIFDEPVAAPAGTVVSLIGRYDNTEDNWDNPNSPPEDIAAGKGYREAKLYATVDYLLDTHLKVEEIFVPKERPELEGSTGMSFATPITLETGAEGETPVDEKDAGNLGEAIKSLATPGNEKDIYWCPMRGNPCELTDYHGPGTCDDCFMDLKPKDFFFKDKELASANSDFPLTKVGRQEVYWCPNRGNVDHNPTKDYFAPGECEEDGVTLIHKARYEQVHTFTCMTPSCGRYQSIFYGPGLCPTCGQPVVGMGHMDHNPVHGGWQFFMSDNLYHHLEGCMHEEGLFKLYLYDDWKNPLDARNFKGSLFIEKEDSETGEVTEEEFAMYVKREGDTWLTTDVPVGFPITFYTKVWLAGEEKRYDFEFEELTIEPAEDAVTGPILLHAECKPITVPPTLDLILKGIVKYERELTSNIERGEWLKLHCPALYTKQLVDGLEDYQDGLNIRERGTYKKLRALVGRSALALDRAGDSQDPPRVRNAYQSYAEGMEMLREIYKDKFPN